MSGDLGGRRDAEGGRRPVSLLRRFSLGILWCRRPRAHRVVNGNLLASRCCALLSAPTAEVHRSRKMAGSWHVRPSSELR